MNHRTLPPCEQYALPPTRYVARPSQKPRRPRHLLDPEHVRLAIAAEEELEGDMPDDVWSDIQRGRSAAAEVLRIVVRQTKRGIAIRLGLTLPRRTARKKPTTRPWRVECLNYRGDRETHRYLAPNPGAAAASALKRQDIDEVIQVIPLD